MSIRQTTILANSRITLSLNLETWIREHRTASAYVKVMHQPGGKSFSPTIGGCSLNAFVLKSPSAAIDGLLLIPNCVFCPTLFHVSSHLGIGSNASPNM